MFYSNNNYHYAFSFLFLPFLMLLMALAYTYRRISSKTTVEPQKMTKKREKLAKPFYIYTFAVLSNTVGLVPYTLILLKASEILKPTGQEWIVPLIYLLIQGIDAPVALIAGYAYDKFGIRVLFLPFVLSLFPSLLTMVSVELSTLLAAAVVFGLVLGMQESIYRAAVSQLTPISSRGTAYGIFNTAYGVGLLISGIAYGLLMEFKALFTITIFYALVTQITATASLIRVRKLFKYGAPPSMGT